MLLKDIQRKANLLFLELYPVQNMSLKPQNAGAQEYALKIIYLITESRALVRKV